MASETLLYPRVNAIESKSMKLYRAAPGRLDPEPSVLKADLEFEKLCSTVT